MRFSQKINIGEEEIMHMFLLNKLPGKDIATNHAHRNIILLLRASLEICIKQGFFPIPKTIKTFHDWTQFEHFEDSPLTDRIHHTIVNLNEGDLVPLYLSSQNAGIMLSSERTQDGPPSSIVLSSFQASSSSESVMSQEGDLLVDFPEQSIKITNSKLLRSKELGDVLDLLIKTVFEMAQPTATKARKTVAETRDVVDPMFATDWLTHLLCDENSKSDDTFPQIRKKIRDDVVLENNVGVPFRRSGLWTTVKVVLQISLIRELGEKFGLFAFKCVMINTLAMGLELFHENCTNNTYSDHQADMKVQMMRKIARRLVKLNGINEGHKKEQNDALLWIESIVTKLLTKVEQVIKEQWLKAAVEVSIPQNVVVSHQQKSAMLEQICPNLKEEIAARKEIRDQNASHCSANNYPIPNCPSRTSVPFPIVNTSSTWHEADFELFEIENWVRLNLDTYCSKDHCSEIESLILTYSKKAMTHYKDDPIGHSRLILTVLKCIQILDKITITTHNLYKEHECGIDLEFIKRLLLPRLCDIEMAHALATYFRRRNSNSMLNPSLISENSPTESSFSVRFASESNTMEALRLQIWDTIDKEIASKHHEVLQVREQCKKYRKSIRLMNCQYEYDTYTERNEHSSSCGKCQLQNTLDRKLVSVSPYEKRLPCYKTQQYAVVFELKIPKELAILRDMLYFFKTDILNQPWLNLETTGDWISSTFVRHYNSSGGTNLKLGSTTKPSAVTHWNRNISVDNNEDCFVLNNGFNQMYHGTSVLGQLRSPFETRCTFLMSTDPKSYYCGMQWAIDWADHCQNNVLARQCECPSHLSIKEFLSFGTLRAGNRIQYRNIVIALTNDSLSWNAEEVFMLICQAQFQYGEFNSLFSKNNDEMINEPHEDLLDDIFAMELLKILEDKIESNKKKWSDPYTLCTLAAITCRVLEVANTKEKTVTVLRKCRQIASDWTVTLQALIGKAYAAPEKEKNTLKLKLVLSALALALTFHTSPKHVQYVMSTSEDSLHWLHAISILYNEVFWNFEGRMKVLGITPLQRCLLRLSMNIGLTLEPAIHRIKNLGGSFSSFTCQKWKVSPTFCEGWLQCGKPQIYECSGAVHSDGTVHHIYLDILFGRFLVDGLPVSRLPEQIVRCPIYQRVFQKAEFTVQPNQNDKGITVFTTTSTYKNCTYQFYEQNQRVVIIELSENNGNLQSFELLPYSLLETDFPFTFYQKFSHWWNSETNMITFRPKHFDKSNFSEIEYKWDLKTNRTEEVLTSRKLISLHSGVFSRICTNLQKIEPLTHIHAWTKDEMIEVELTRLGLKFYLDMNNHQQLRSREFPGMCVDPNQNIGTLVGLENKLVLVDYNEEDFEPSRKVIVPHGYLTISSEFNTGHQKVTVDLTENLRSPGFFAYTVDHRKKLLQGVANQASWIYLAALHGSTASPLPDSFTEVTGTEMAVHILQLARVWSCQPYDEECLATLKMISGFSPIRKFYPNHKKCQQKITWPSGLAPTCAHEGFCHIVNFLLEESKKLGPLFPKAALPPVQDGKTGDDEKDNSTVPLLSHRHYWRQNTLDNPHLDISAFGQARPSPVPYQRQSLLLDSNAINQTVRELSYLCGHWKSFVDPCAYQLVRNLLITRQKLTGQRLDIIKIQKTNFVECLSEFDLLKDSWIDLYRLAISVGHNESLRRWWTVIITSLAFHGVDMHQLRILHCVAVYAKCFQHLHPPTTASYADPSSNFSISVVNSTIEKNSIPFNGNGYSTKREKNNANTKYGIEQDQEISEIVSDVNRQWIPRHTSSVSLTKYGIHKIRVGAAEVGINQLIKKWYENSKLDEFLEQFEIILKTVNECEVNSNELNNRLSFPKLEKLSNICEHSNYQPKFDLASIIQQSASLLQLDTSREETIYSQMSSDLMDYDAKHFDTDHGFIQCARVMEGRSDSVWEKLTSLLTASTFGVNSLISAGLFPRLVPSTILPIILWKNIKNDAVYNNWNLKLQKIQDVVGAVCVYWTLEQKMIRCARFMRACSSMQVALEREKETEGLKSWRPRNNPEWLLLELELNMTIRPIQIEVAQAMLKPSSNSNSVLQLNMGEGKTSLIVPMLAASIANGNQLCRVTVIKSIFETNVNSLKHTLGGLINRRLHVIPCRRDIDFDLPLISSIKSAYEDCLKNKGVVVTLPEYRLSFQLKGYEFARKEDNQIDNAKVASALIELQAFLDKHSRDILDESDDILSVKYQLIYTVGGQLPIGGGNLRWEIAQKLLKRLPVVMRKLETDYGERWNAVIEYFEEEGENSSIFPKCRLLSPDVYPKLISKLSDDFIDGNLVGFAELKMHEKLLIKRFLTDNSITENDIKEVMELKCLENSEKQSILLIMAGYLRFGVLESALSKRWRVNFGVNPKGHRRTAVPFKAKDVASERTEFGHPDMAIILTQISYYYSGLNDSQLMECFDYLKSKFHIDPTSEYDRWIKYVPANKIDLSVKNYNGVNLEDHGQRTQHLFPILRKSMAVIDFWLSNFVFPKESKQFKGKMTCTAWDLVSETKSLLTTGFSGTNDSKNLLPVLIHQNDLKKLEHTNLELESILVSPEMHYRHFSVNTTSVEILEQLKQEGIKVLLDCGALMLQLDNDQVANEWLKIDPSFEAVVFFNKKNFLTVRDRENSESCPFELSPFRERLDVCGIYLDDEHTRGTDLKFPKGSRACVTLGSGLTRDKMAQACMRMRMLGNGHFVTFWASNEVHNKIKILSGPDDIGGQEVLEWVKLNSKQFEEEGMIYWTHSAMNYCTKRGAESIFRSLAAIPSAEGFCQLGKQCSEKEVIELKKMYCHARNESPFSTIYPKWFAAAKATLTDKTFNHDVETCFSTIESKCRSRIMDIIPYKRYFSQLLDEEQEKELEKEVEQENERQLPGKAKPYQHQITEGLITALLHGKLVDGKKNSGILSIAEVFTDTTEMDKLQQECWGSSVFCTRDFKKTVVRESSSDTLTEFLRPVNWIVKLEKSSVLLAISSFEANALISRFRVGEFKAALHLYNPRTLPNHSILIDNPRLTLPSSNIAHKLVLWHTLIPPLSLCAGNMYFSTPEEEEAFANWMGIIPRPREEYLQNLFHLGLIDSKNGFVVPENRYFEGCPISSTAFHSDPGNLVADICRIRNQSQFPQDSHVAKIVMNGMRTLLFPPGSGIHPEE